MQVTHEWRVFESRGRRIIDKGEDSIPAAYLTLQRYGYYGLMPFLVSLSRVQSLDVKHPSGAPWRFVMRLDYRRIGRGESRLRSARLVVLPQLSRFQIPSLLLWPRQDAELSLPFLERYLQVFHPH